MSAGSDNDDKPEHYDSRQSFSLRAFSEMKDLDTVGKEASHNATASDLPGSSDNGNTTTSSASINDMSSGDRGSSNNSSSSNSNSSNSSSSSSSSSSNSSSSTNYNNSYGNSNSNISNSNNNTNVSSSSSSSSSSNSSSSNNGGNSVQNHSSYHNNQDNHHHNSNLHSTSGNNDIHHHFVAHDLYKHPPSIVELNNSQKTADDSAIKRLTMGKVINTAAFDSNQSSTKTTPRRPSDKHYIAPTNTFIASNGDVYEIEPFVLPPPTEIAALFKELKNRRDRSDSGLGTDVTQSPKNNQRDVTSSVYQQRLSVTSSQPPNIQQSSSSGHTSTFPSLQTRSAEASPDLKPLIRPPNIFAEAQKPTKSLASSFGLASIIEEQDDYGSTTTGLHMRKPSATMGSSGGGGGGGGLGGGGGGGGGQAGMGFDDSFLGQRKKRGSSIVDPPSPSKNHEYFHGNKFSLRNYLLREMLGIGEPGHLEPAAVGYMDNFLNVPSRVERLITFGFFICLDAFLYVITVLPIRVLYSILLLVCEVSLWLRKHVIQGQGVGRRGMSMMNEGFFHRSHLYDVMRGCFMILGCFVLQLLNMSRVYHYIRGQTLIKLYVLTAMMEIFDKLLCSFGQDSFDSLYCLTLMRPEVRKIAFSFVIAALYVIFHSGLYFLYVATLTVAINSSDQALVTVLILNNFAEIKSFVFKKFDKQNLFQLSCSDITERFQLVLFLLCINAVSLAQAGSTWLDVLPSHVMVFFVLVSGEAIADWIKHAFISKFNFINANVYDDFVKVLRRDILNNHKDKILLDQTYAITKRVGLAQIPLGCVFVRYMSLAFSAPAVVFYFSTKSRLWMVLQFCFWFAMLFIAKVSMGVSLIFYAGAIHNKELRHKEEEEKRLEEKTGKPRLERRASINQLSNIERYTVYKGRVVG